MIAGRRKQQTRKRPSPLLGLLLVVLFLGHDALMALEGVAAPHEAATASHHAAQLSASEHAAPARDNSTPAPKHPDNCSVGLSALRHSGDDITGLDQALSPGDPVTASFASAPGWAGAIAWEEPRWPPGRWRALMQVYRI